MDIKQRQTVNKYLDLFFRRKVFIFVVLLLCLPIGLGVYLNIPKEYQASCLLSYQPQKISPNKLSPDVDSTVREIVNTLSQVVMSRTNLEDIIQGQDLYPQQRKSLPIEDVVEILRKNVAIQTQKHGNVFTVSFTDADPEKVVRVTNAVAAKFIEENLKYRQDRALDTSSYTEQELEMAKKVMDEKERVMRDYKLKNYDEMPVHRQANISRLTALQGQYQRKQESIENLERTLVLIQDQENNRRSVLDGLAGKGEGGDEFDRAKRLADLHSTLNSLLLKYTEKHPEIVRIRKLIDKLEKEIQSGKSGSVAGNNSSQLPSTDELQEQTTEQPKGTYDKVLMQLEVQRRGVKLNIANLESEKKRLQGEVELYEKWIAAAPIREAEWSSLTREYGQLKKHYDYLVAQNLQAESMLNLEERQKGSQFRIEDPARYSGKPINPNFLKIMGMSLAVGLGLGLAGTLVLDFFDGSFRDPETIEPVLGIPLLATIPYVEIDSEQKKRTLRSVLTTIMLLFGSVGVVALFVVAWSRGYILLL